MSKKAKANKETKLKGIKTTWDLKGLYYKSATDPKLEADIKTAERAYSSFAKKWSTVDFAATPEKLDAALFQYEKLAGLAEISRPGRYFGFRKCLNVNDGEADQHLAKLSERLRKASDQILFFSLNLGRLPKSLQKKLLSDPSLTHYKYFLKQIFESAKHDLTEPEEKIIRLKARQASGMWHEAVEKIISNRKIVWKKGELALPEAIETLDLLPAKDKSKLWALITKELRQIGEVAEHEMNAIVSDDVGEKELRGYKKPYSATVQAYEDDEKAVENLVKAVSTKGFAQSREFYRLKAKYHGVKTLPYELKYQSIGSELKLTFEEAVEICREVFYSLKKEYGEIFDHMLTNGQIDVFPRPGKRGGAFMSSEVGHPTHVFLNHVANFKSLETLAHEMGHAIHGERSKVNSPLYEGFSTTTAETASTLFENLIFDAVYAKASEADRLILLHDRITRDIATIERQIAFFNCELEIHTSIKNKGFLQSTELAAIMRKHLQSYLGSSVSVSEDDGYSYVYIPHLRYGFYVYTYSFGILMSTIMANRYKEDRTYIEKIDKFLSAGGSDTVANVFKSIGIDTMKENTFLEALNNQAEDIALFKQLLKSKKR